VRPTLPNELVAIAAPHHPRLGGPSFAAAEFVDEAFFVREQGSGTRLAVERFLEEAGLLLDAVVELGSDSAIKQVVMAGLGMSILSRQAIEFEVGVNRLVVLR
jgi:DNA-binding transcriptional LysR family regulator